MKCSTDNYCITSEYSGEVASYKISDNKSIPFQFWYRIPSNSTTLFEEYWVYDGINTIGSVGGTLGVCIGFSFTGLISYLINIFQHAIFIFKAKLVDRKFTKPKSQKYGSLEIENKVKQNVMPNVDVGSRKQIFNERYTRNEIEIFLEEMFIEKMDKKLEEKIRKILEEKFKYT